MRVIEDKCRGCKMCVRSCRYKAIEMVGGIARIGDACVGCRVCASVCPFEAIDDEWIDDRHIAGKHPKF